MDQMLKWNNRFFEKIKLDFFSTMWKRKTILFHDHLLGREIKKNYFIFILRGRKNKTLFFPTTIQTEGEYISSNDWLLGSFSWQREHIHLWELQERLRMWSSVYHRIVNCAKSYTTLWQQRAALARVEDKTYSKSSKRSLWLTLDYESKEPNVYYV